MKQIIFFLILFQTTSPVFAEEQNTKASADNRSEKVGASVAFGIAQQVDFLTVGIESPSISWEFLENRLNFGVFFDVSLFSARNLFLEKYSGHLIDIQNFGLSSGLIIRDYVTDTFASFMQLGTNMIWQNATSTVDNLPLALPKKKMVQFLLK